MILHFPVIVTNKELLDDFNANIKDLLPKLMEIEAKPQTTTDSIYDKLKNYYFNGSDVINGDHNKHKFIDVSGTKRISLLMDNLDYITLVVTDVFRSSFSASVL